MPHYYVLNGKVVRGSLVSSTPTLEDIGTVSQNLKLINKALL
jgi:hypothetical protein